MRKLIASALLATTLPFAAHAIAADYTIDTKDAHASIMFEVSHLGFGFVNGRFNEFSGTINYDADKPEASSVNVKINTKSVDSNHADRDKHIRSGDFLNTEKSAEATFASSSFTMGEDKKGTLAGDFTLNGVTRPVEIAVTMIGAGNDPWGNARVGFQGTTSIDMKDYNFKTPYGSVALKLNIEAIKNK